jgi:hypothetical protein
MKKLFITAALALGLFTTNQSSAQSTATSTFNVVLEDVMSLRINGSTTTNVTYNDIDAYVRGKDGTLTDYLTVISTKAYKVTVKLGTVSTNPSGLEDNLINLAAIPSNNSRGRTDNVTDRSGTSIDGTERNFILASGSTFSSMEQSAEALFDIDYHLYGGSKVFDKTAGTNIIPVVFTIAAP